MKTTFVMIKLLKNVASGSDYISLCLAEGEEISGSLILFSVTSHDKHLIHTISNPPSNQER